MTINKLLNSLKSPLKGNSWKKKEDNKRNGSVLLNALKGVPEDPSKSPLNAVLGVSNSPNSLTVKRRTNNTVTLQRDGLLACHLSFDVGSNREKQIKTKSRSFKHFYRIEGEDFKMFLEKNYLNPRNGFKVEVLYQVFKVSFRGLFFEVAMEPSKMGNSFATNWLNYLKYLTYACMSKYKKLTEQNQSTSPDGDFLEGLCIDEEDLLKSTGLIMVGDSFSQMMGDNESGSEKPPTSESVNEFIVKQAKNSVITLKATEETSNKNIASLQQKNLLLSALITLASAWEEWDNPLKTNAEDFSFKNYLQEILKKPEQQDFEVETKNLLNPTQELNQIAEIFKTSLIDGLEPSFIETINRFDGSPLMVNALNDEINKNQTLLTEENKRLLSAQSKISDYTYIIDPQGSKTKPSKTKLDRIERARRALKKKMETLPLTPAEVKMTPFSFVPISSTLVFFDGKGDSAGLDLSAFVYTAEAAQTLQNQARLEDVTVSTEQLLIEARTTYFIVTSTEVTNGFKSKVPFFFSFSEDGESIMQMDVSQEYLTSILDECLFKFIRPLHSAFITYRSVLYKSFEAKDWEAPEKNVARASPMRLLQETRVFFKRLIFGENPRDFVNGSSNLMFSSLWEESTGSTNPNRLLSCSAYSSQLEVRDDFNNGTNGTSVFLNMESALNSEILISEYPKVSLIPCYERGTILQTNGDLVFRGLVNNSSSR